MTNSSQARAIIAWVDGVLNGREPRQAAEGRASPEPDARFAGCMGIPPQQVSGLVRALDRHREQHGGSHLKRVNPKLRTPDAVANALAILLCVGTDQVSLTSDVLDVLSQCAAVVQAVQVPEHAPLTRRQFEEATSVWPVHFHEAAATRFLAVWSDAPPASEQAS